MRSSIRSIKRFLRNALGLALGRQPRIHRIPFGPLKNQKIFVSFNISPRMYLGIDEPWIAELASGQIDPGDVVYDIGAHIGYTCLLLARQVGDSGVVHAFEVIPSVANHYLKKTVQANRLSNVVVHAVGLSTKKADLLLPVGETLMTDIHSTGKTPHMERCRVISLDEYCKKQRLPPPSLMKIDIEGAEIDCLLGAKQLITRHLPSMIIEFHNKSLLEKGLRLLRPLGYKFQTQRDGQIDRKFLLSIHDTFHESVFCSVT